MPLTQAERDELQAGLNTANSTKEALNDALGNNTSVEVYNQCLQAHRAACEDYMNHRDAMVESYFADFPPAPALPADVDPLP